MTPASIPNNDTSLRGPLLASHRALRKAVAGRCAQFKGDSSAAASARRQPGVNTPPSDDVLRPLLLSQALSKVLLDFGGPELIPQEARFVDYFRMQQQKITDGCRAAANDYLRANQPLEKAGQDPSAASDQAVSRFKAMAAMDAYALFAELFGVAFAPIFAASR